MNLLANTLLLAVAVTAIAVLLGAPLGLALARRHIPGARILIWLLAAPSALPPYVLATAWLDLLGRNGTVAQILGFSPVHVIADVGLYSLPGAAMVMALSLYPIPMAVTWLAVRALDSSIYDSARMAASFPLRLRHVIFPLIFPAFGAAVALLVLLVLPAFSVPSLLQTPVYSVEVYTRFSSDYDPAGAFRHALPLFILGLASLVICVWRFKHIAASAYTNGDALSSRPRRASIVVSGLLWFTPLLTLIMPLALLLSRALPLSSLLAAWQTAKEEIFCTALLASTTASLCVAIGLACAALPRRATWLLLPALGLPYLVSGPVLGVAIITLMNAPGWRGWLYDGFSILVIACTLRYVIFAYLGALAALALRDTSAEDTASVYGARRGMRFLRITLPRIAPWLLLLWALSFVLVASDLDTVVLVSPPGWTPLSLRLFTLMHYGPSALVAALSLLSSALALGVAGGCCMLGMRMLKRL